MSDEETPRMPSLREMMGLGPPPTPTERVDAAKRSNAKRKAALSAIQSARLALRELDVIGYRDGDGRVERAAKHLAVLEDRLEGSLVWPVEP